MKWNRAMMLLGTISLLSLAIVIFTPVVNIAGRAMSVPSDLRPADAIVVLGAGLMNDGSLTLESMQRLLFGMRLYKQGLAPILILSGPARPNTAPESAIRAHIATEMGIPPSAILELPEVDTTRDEARQAAMLLSARNQKHVLVVTESLHMWRSKLVFEAAGLTVSAASSDDYPTIATSSEERLLLLRNVMMHSVALLYYKLAGYI